MSNPKLSKYTLGPTIGEGTYGKVKLATHITTNETVAIKFIIKSRLLKFSDSQRIQNELQLIMNLNHPNILKAFEIFEDDTYYYIVMERPKNGDLFNYVCEKKRLTFTEASIIFFQVVNAIDYIHSQRIVHRDIKPENILLTEDMIIKLGDFGFAKQYVDNKIKLKTSCGSACYSAPEMLRRIKYLPQPIDVWGLGIILFIMVYGELPFDGNSEDVLHRKITQCSYIFPHFYNNSVKNLLKRIFVADPSKRITLAQIKEDPVYNTGKANFMKVYKVYHDNGDISPNVKEYLKDMTIKYLRKECSLEWKVKDIEQTTDYKIMYWRLLHKTNWNDYKIPVTEKKKCIYKNQSAGNLNSFSDSNSKCMMAVKAANTKDKDKNVKQPSQNKTVSHKRNEYNMDMLLRIPEHQALSSSRAMVANVPKTKNENKELIKTITKFGITSHSFDKKQPLHFSASCGLLGKDGKKGKISKPCNTEVTSHKRWLSATKGKGGVNELKVNGGYNLTNYSRGDYTRDKKDKHKKVI